MDNLIPNYAGFWRRLTAVLVDIAILWVPCSLFGWLVDEALWDVLTFSAAEFALNLIIWTVYYGLLESSRYQATVGKLIMGLKVTDMAGHRISFLRASGRYISQIASALLLGIGFFMIAWTERKQGLHDIVCGCLVIMKSQKANKSWRANRP